MAEPTIGDLLNQYFHQGRTGKHDEAAQRIRLAIAAELQKIRAEADDETYEIGKRDGYSEAVQQIDQLTGGDGEYRYCLGGADPDRHTPGPAEMIQRIVDRFEVLNLLDEATKDGRDQPDDAPSPQTNVRLDVDRLAARVVTAACELDGPADPAGDDTILITTKDLEAVVHRQVTAALEASL